MTSELLREAAALMRERAEDARAGRWVTWQSELNPDAFCVGAEWESGKRHVATVRGSQPEGNAINAAHIAGMQPVVALVIADWLDSHAGDLQMSMGQLSSCDSPGDTEHALMLARAYLGRDA